MQSESTKTVTELERACRAERRRGVEGHWAYSLPYHVELWRQLTAARQREALAKFSSGSGAGGCAASELRGSAEHHQEAASQ